MVAGGTRGDLGIGVMFVGALLILLGIAFAAGPGPEPDPLQHEAEKSPKLRLDIEIRYTHSDRAIYARVINTGTSPQTVDAGDFVLIGDNGTVGEHSYMATVFSGDSFPSWIEVYPGEAAQGWIGFKPLPSDEEPSMIKYRSSAYTKSIAWPEGKEWEG